jgi:hypothetical protein
MNSKTSVKILMNVFNAAIYLVESSKYGRLSSDIEVRVGNNSIDENVFDIAQEDSHMHIFYFEGRFLSTIMPFLVSVSFKCYRVDEPMSKTSLARVHNGNLVQIFPCRVLLIIQGD